MIAEETCRGSARARHYIEDFESGRMADFHHRQHVELAWSYLTCLSLVETLDRLPRALRRFAASKDLPDLYHETITWAYVLVINERMAEDRSIGDSGNDFESFAVANPDLFAWPSPVLERCYEADTLGSERARRGFVWPDRMNRADL